MNILLHYYIHYVVAGCLNERISNLHGITKDVGEVNTLNVSKDCKVFINFFYYRLDVKVHLDTVITIKLCEEDDKITRCSSST